MSDTPYNPNEIVGHPLLAFNDINEQMHFRAASGVSTTFRDSTSLYETGVEVASKIIDEIRVKEASENIDAANVSFEATYNRIDEAIWSIDQLGGESSKDQESQKRILRDIRSGGSTLNRLLTDLIEIESQKAFDQVNKALRSITGSPYRAKDKLEKLRQELKQLETPDVGTSRSVSHRRLCNALPVLKQLAKKVNRQRLEPALLEKINSAFRSAVSETIKVRSIPVWKENIRRLRQLCEDKAGHASRIRNKLESVFETLQEQHKNTQDYATGLTNTIQLTLTSASTEDIKRSLIQSLRCDHDEELIGAVRDRWQERLIVRADVLAPAVGIAASVSDLIVALPIQVVCSELIDLVEEAIAPSITVYTQIENEGMKFVVYELLRRAEPMVRLGAYETSEELNILPTYTTRVTFPCAKNANDANILANLKNELRQRDSKVEFVESETDREVSMIRMVLNFPIGVDENNRDLLISYKRAATRGHQPHLIGVIDASTDGEAIDILLQLAEHLFED